MSGYVVAQLDEIEEIDDGRIPARPVRRHMGITSFGVNAWTARNAGDRVITEHEEADPDGHEELYVVQRGHARFELDGEQHDAPAGTFVFVPRGIKRTAFAEEAGTTVLAIGAAPGKAYEPLDWEDWAPIGPLYDAGRYAEAIERAQPLLEADPPNPLVLYNVACCEALAGRSADAIGHLRRALELSERLRGLAAEDSDLDPIRHEPGFEELLAG